MLYLFILIINSITFVDFDNLLNKYNIVIVGRITCYFTRSALLLANKDNRLDSSNNNNITTNKNNTTNNNKNNITTTNKNISTIINNYKKYMFMFKLHGNKMFVELKDNPTLMGYLIGKYNQTTIPYIFINGIFIGGYKEYKNIRK